MSDRYSRGRGWAKVALAMTLAGAAAMFGANNGSASKVRSSAPVFAGITGLDQSHSSIEGRVLEGPVYSEDTVPAGMCSRYVRFAAKDVFNIDYPVANSWQIRDSDKIGEINVNSVGDLEDLARSDALKPGMIVGFFYPKSKYNVPATESGAGYTHVALYLGNENGRLFFADKFGKLTRTREPVEDLVEKGSLVPREVLYRK